MAVTPFLKLQKPPFDTIPWDDAVNGNMDSIDAFLAQFMSVPNFVGVWKNATAYIVGQQVLDISTSLMYACLVTHTSAALPTTFAQDRIAHPLNWGVQAGLPADVSSRNTGRNFIENSMFNVAQRGAGPFTTNAIGGLDRWQMVTQTDTMSFTQVPQTDAERTQLGDEAAFFSLRNVFTGTANGSNYIEHHVEFVRRLSAKTITFSFWAKAATIPMKLGFNVFQQFGPGGSPFVQVHPTGVAFTLTTGWVRYSVTLAIPSVAGKTIVAGDQTTIRFFYSAGAPTQTVSAGGVGVQSGTISLWGVQAEVSTTATPLDKPSPAAEFDACLRYFTAMRAVRINTFSASFPFHYFTLTWPTRMRAPPTSTFQNVSFFTAANLRADSTTLFSGTYLFDLTTVNSSATAQFDLLLSSEI